MIRLVSQEVQPKEGGFHVVGAMTLVGQTRTVPLDVVTRIAGDTLEAARRFRSSRPISESRRSGAGRAGR